MFKAITMTVSHSPMSEPWETQLDPLAFSWYPSVEKQTDITKRHNTFKLINFAHN